MEKDMVRLKCLEIAASKSVDPVETLHRAKAFFDFVCQPEPEHKQYAHENKKLDASKKTDNSKILP